MEGDCFNSKYVLVINFQFQRDHMGTSNDRHIELPVNRMFFYEHFVRTNNKETSNARVTVPL